MPDVIVSCPQCERPLRVPEDLIGRLVKCPACGLTFSVPAGGESQPITPAPPEQETAFSRRHPDEGGSVAAEQQIPGALYGDPSGPLDQHERARSLIMPAAILLLLTGILGLLIDLWQVVWVAMNTWQPPAPAPAQQPPDFIDALREAATGPVPIVIGAVFAVVSIVVIIAAAQMLRLRSYGFAVTGTVLAMANFVNFCCVLGLPVGIWALVILSKPEVKSAFQRTSPPPAGEALT